MSAASAKQTPTPQFADFGGRPTLIPDAFLQTVEPAAGANLARNAKLKSCSNVQGRCASRRQPQAGGRCQG